MEFRRELKRRCDSEFLSLKSRFRPKPAKKGSIRSVQNSLDAFGKLTEATNQMVLNIANELYPGTSISKEKATEIARDLMRDYLRQIKSNSGFK